MKNQAYKPILFNSKMVRAILEDRKTKTRRIAGPNFSDTHMELFKDKRLVEIQNEIEGVTIIHNPDGTTTHRLRAAFERQPRYRPGDILWVRETWTEDGQNFYYRADFESDWLDPCETLSGGYPIYCSYHPGCEGCMREKQRIHWRPSIHMPKEAARIFLRVKDVKPAQLQDSFNDVVTVAEELKAEGIDIGETCENCIECYGEPMCRAYVDEDGMMTGECHELDGPRSYFSDLWDSTVKPYAWKWDANPWVWIYTFERIEKPEGWPYAQP